MGERLYVLGALVTDGFTASGESYVYDLATNSWSQLTSMPLGTERGASGTAVIGAIPVAGGEGNPNDPSGVFPETEAYDPAKDGWQKLEPMLTPRHGTGGAALKGVFYVPGGATEEGFDPVVKGGRGASEVRTESSQDRPSTPATVSTSAASLSSSSRATLATPGSSN